MGEVVQFRGETTLDTDAASMLRNIADNLDPDKAFVICWPKDGSMPTYHGNTSDMPVILMRLQQFIHWVYSEEINGD